MRRFLALAVLGVAVIVTGCHSNKRCDSPSGCCNTGHSWFNHPWFKKSPPPPAPIVGQPPPGSVVVPPGGAPYNPPALNTGPVYGPTPDANAPPVPPGGIVR